MGNAHTPDDTDALTQALAGHDLVDLYPLVLLHHAQAGVVAIPHPSHHYTVSTVGFQSNLDRALRGCPEAVTMVVYACGPRTPLDVWRELRGEVAGTMLCQIQILRPGESRRLYLSPAEILSDKLPEQPDIGNTTDA